MAADAESHSRCPAVVFSVGIVLTTAVSVWLHNRPDSSVAAPALAFLAGGLSCVLARTLTQRAVAWRSRVVTLEQKRSDDVKRLALVAQRTANVVVIADAQRRVSWVNESFERVTGYSAHEVIGRSPGSLLQYEGTDPATVARLRASLNAGQAFFGELRNRGKTGRIYWIELEIRPLHDDEGVLIGFMAMELEITERKNAEAALQASRSLLDNTGRIGGVGGCVLDVTTGVIDWTEQACRILDIDPRNPPTLKRFLSLCGPDGRVLIRQAIKQFEGGAQEWDFELPVLSVAGRFLWVRVAARRGASAGGAIQIQGAVQDVTARRAMEAEVLSSAELLRTAIDTVDQAFVLFDAQDGLVMCNDQYRSVYASPGNALSAGDRFDCILRASAEAGRFPVADGRVEAWVAERVAQHRVANSSVVMELDCGQVLRVVERRLPNGHTVGFHIDITDLVRASDKAERANQVLSEFIATISHELRTPLQAILGFAELGGLFAQAEPQFQGMFGEIHDAGQKMLTLVNDLLDVTKIDGTMGSMVLHRADIVPLMAEVAKGVQPLVAARRLSLDWPQPLPQVSANVDAFRIQQVMRNVLSNAIRFAPVGSCIQIAFNDGGAEGVTLSIRDHGPGIPSQELESIFDPFTQSSRTRDGAGGTGLGLTISRKIMGAHGGRISADNAPDGGAVMCLWMPPCIDVGSKPDDMSAAALNVAPTAAPVSPTSELEYVI